MLNHIIGAIDQPRKTRLRRGRPREDHVGRIQPLFLQHERGIARGAAYGLAVDVGVVGRDRRALQGVVAEDLFEQRLGPVQIVAPESAGVAEPRAGRTVRAEPRQREADRSATEAACPSFRQGSFSRMPGQMTSGSSPMRAEFAL